MPPKTRKLHLCSTSKRLLVLTCLFICLASFRRMGKFLPTGVLDGIAGPKPANVVVGHEPSSVSTNRQLPKDEVVPQRNDIKSPEKDPPQGPIPHVMWFTYKHDVLKTKTPKQYYENVMKTIEAYRSEWNEPNATVRFVVDDDCKELLRQVDSREKTMLVKVFDETRGGDIKADLCRVAALYLHGGYYFDLDLEVVKPVRMDPKVSFSTAQNDAWSGMLFQAFLAATPGHPVLRENLQDMMDYYYYQSLWKHCNGLMGPCTLLKSWNKTKERGVNLILKEINLQDSNLYPSVPQRGDKHDCHWVVHDPDKKEVHFYSRIVGSRYCPEPVKTVTLQQAAVSEPHDPLEGPIPHIMWFTYMHDVLKTKAPKQYYENVMKTIESYRSEWNEPNATVHFVVDDDCREILRQVDSLENTTLVKAFDETPGGDIKADLCRVAALFLHGGYYFDLDLEVIKPVRMDPNVSFSTAQNDAWSGIFFQAFLAATPGHPVLKQNLRDMTDYYFGNRSHWQHCGGLMGPCTLLKSWNQTKERGTNLILKEFFLPGTNLYPNLTRRGENDGCHWIVHDKDKQEVHFYSRIVGSRYCPAPVEPAAVHRTEPQGPIPHIMWFTYMHDVLKTKAPKQYYDNVMKTIESYRSEWNEPNATVRFVVDDDCREILRQVDSLENITLAKAFDETPGGDIKADLCRVAALFLHGGYYFDLDLEVVKPVKMDPNVSFSTAQNDAWAGIFFQAFLAATPGHPVLKRNLRDMMDYYYGNRSHWKHCGGLMGPCTLLKSWNQTKERGTNLILKEINLGGSNLYPNLTRRGENDGCHWIVHDKDKQEVHFYSRIVGSRYCPAPVEPAAIQQTAVSEPRDPLKGPIPHIMWFTYMHDVLKTKQPKQYYENVMKTVEAYRSEWNEPNATVRFVVDDDCKEILRQVDSRENTTLAKAFDETPGGDIKADLCRVAALFLHGGYYFDLDLEVVKPVQMDPKVSFSTAQNEAWSGIFFQAFLAATPGHPVLKQNLRDMMDYYYGNRSHWMHCNGMMGPCTLLKSWNQTAERGVNLILKEINLQGSNLYPNLTRRGESDGCHWIVHDQDKQEVNFYSRIVGSRYCPATAATAAQQKTAVSEPQGPIPHIMWFTYMHDVLKTKAPKHYYDNIIKTIEAYRSEWNEPNATVRFVVDDDCKEILRQVDSVENTTLARAFDETGGGDIKADLCRIAALYLHGGYYFDLDLEVVKPVKMDPKVSFSTAQNDDWSGIFSQAFLATTPGHPVLRENLQDMMDYYYGNQSHWKHCNGLMGPCTLLNSWNRTKDRGASLILKEINLQGNNIYPNVTQRGKSYDCHWVVHDADRQEVSFYSRILGSRNCPE